MNDYPLISVITVTFNCAEILQETINSIVEQDYSNLEYIIIDGNSSDGTIDVINKNKTYISKLLIETDNGIYDAMNKGIDLASGEYVIFMNAGDSFYNRIVISTIFKNNTISIEKDIIFGDTKVFFDNYTRLVKGHYPNKLNPMSFNHQSVFVRSALLKNNKFDTKFKICSDKNQFAKFFSEKKVYLHIPIIIAKITAIGYSNSNRIKTSIETRLIYKLNGIPTYKIEFQIMKSFIITFIENLAGKKFIAFIRRLIIR